MSFMSANEIDVNAVNARAKGQQEMTIGLCDKCVQSTNHDSQGNCLKCPQTPMTKIPSVEDKVVTEFFTKCRVHLRSDPHGRCAVEHALVQALTAEREARDQEWRDAIQRLINVSNEHSSDDWFNGLRACRSIKLPTK